MNVSDATLMAFADGALDPAQGAQVEAALAADAALRQRVATMRLQRARLVAAFDAVLEEPVPDRLASLLRQPPVAVLPSQGAHAINLADARAERERRRARYAPSWAQWGGMAASLVLGVLLGTQFSGTVVESDMGMKQGQLVASGPIAHALASQLASEPPAGASVAVQLSFLDKSGNYCRTFSTASMAGLACQHKGQWAVQNLAALDAQPGGEMRQAATALPRSVLETIDQSMVGGALDASGERAARDRGWHSPNQLFDKR